MEFDIITAVTIEINVLWGLTPYIFVQIYTYTVKMEAVSSSETSVCFHLSTQRHEQRTCNLHFRYCLYVQKLLTKNYFANFRKFCGYVMNFIVTPCILIHCILRTSYILLLAVNGQRRLPETCRVVIPTKLEFSASVGFIHKGFYAQFALFP